MTPVVLHTVLGRGASGSVLLGTLRKDSADVAVAVKLCSPDELTERTVRCFPFI